MSTPPHLLSVALTRGHFELDLEISWQERVSVFFGPSGAGKSTLFEALLGLHPTARARVCIGGEWLEDSETGLRRPTWQRGLGWVPQDPTLFPHLDVEANLRFAGPDAQTLERAVEVLELRPLLTRDVRDLSGGERQRVAIGRALGSGPRALLLDEPLASLDVTRRANVLRDLIRVRDALELPMLVITHDPDEAQLLGERVAVIEAGRIVASGAPAEVLWSRAVLPLSEALGLENVLEGNSVAGVERCLVTDGGLRLALPVATTAGVRMSVGVRAEDVVLAVDPPGRISPRNVLPARVTHCEPTGDDAFVHLALDPGGERLVAKLTAAAVRKLELHADTRVHALIKAQAIRRLA